MATLTINGKEYIIPAVTLGQLRAGMMDKMKKSDELVEKNWLDSVMLRGELVAEALIAKYPNLTVEDVLNALDPISTGSCFLALLGASGITTPGEATATKSEAGT